MLKAIIFDVDGTLADTEKAHLQAFNSAFSALNLRWRWSEALYIELLAITGGRERLHHYWKVYETADFERHNPDVITTRLNLIHAKKTQFYTRLIRNEGIPLRPGIRELIETAHQQGIKLAIATTTTPQNAQALLETTLGPEWQTFFPIIEDASTASRKKPDPLVYRQALERLGEHPEQCIAIEDSENGLKAAAAAGLRVVITPTAFTNHQVFDGAFMRYDNLHPASELLNTWRANNSPIITRNMSCPLPSAVRSPSI